MALFSFRTTRQPQAGAESYAFRNSQKNPQFPVWTGPGVTYPSGAIRATQPAPYYYPGQLFTQVGFGGLIYSSFYNAPLLLSRIPLGPPIS